MTTYSPYDTLRRVDNHLLEDYLKSRSLDFNLDIASRRQTDIEPIYEQITKLPKDIRTQVETELRNVATLTDKQRIKALFHALQYEGIEFPQSKKIRDSFDKSMWALLNHPTIFNNVLQNSFPYTQQRHWQSFPYSSTNTPQTDEITCENLSDKLKEFFHRLDGRGEHCKVQHHQFQDYHYMIAYPSDYPEKLPEWKDDNTFDLSHHKLACVVIFVFQELGTSVDIYAEEQIDVMRSVYTIWAKEVLGITTTAPKNKKSFDLTAFTQANHALVIPPKSPIKSLDVYKIVFAPHHNPTATYMIAVDITNNKKALHEELQAKNLHILNIKKIGIEATLQSDTSDKTKTRRFEISGTSCTLKHEDESAQIRALLKELGIDTTQ